MIHRKHVKRMTDEPLSLFIRNRSVLRSCLAAAIFFTTASLCARAENLPDMRPALVGTMKNALVNRIDTQALMRKGVQHAAVMFHTWIRPSGSTFRYSVYGGTPGSEPLREEVRRQIQESVFIPAVYGHHYLYSTFDGTVTFSVIDGKPHLRVYATQEKSEMAEGHDFISPQVVFLPNHRYDRVDYPSGSWVTEEKPGTVDIELSVDAKGTIKNVRALSEIHPERNSGRLLSSPFATARSCPHSEMGVPSIRPFIIPFCLFQVTFNGRPSGRLNARKSSRTRDEKIPKPVHFFYRSNRRIVSKFMINSDIIRIQN